MKPITCPSCGAENTLPNPAVVSIVCPYCDNISYIDADGIKSTGKQSRLSEGFSRLFRGGTGKLHDRSFIVLGRVRYAFGRGFWDEWYIEWDSGETAWLTEDNHQFSLQEEISTTKNVSAEASSIGARFAIKNTEYQVMEIGEARCLGIEGSIPKGILPDESYPYVDGISLDGTKSIGLEFDNGKNARPTIYVGSWITHDALQMEENDYTW